MAKKAKTGQCAVWDWNTFGVDGELPEVDHFVGLIQILFKRWTFQKERCPTTDRLHYQGRGSLHHKKRKDELLALLHQDDELDDMNIDIRQTVTENTKGEPFYCMKLDTRVEGPWSDKTWVKPTYVPIHLRGLLQQLKPFQQQILDTRNENDWFHMNCLLDPDGEKGKSTTASLAELHYGCVDLPPVADFKMLTESLCDILMGRECRKPGIIFVDLPRSLTLTQRNGLYQFMVAIEIIKKGKVADVRHRYRQWWYDSPAIWVFTNHPINVNYISVNRWKFWTFDDSGEALRRVSTTEWISLYADFESRNQ